MVEGLLSKLLHAVALPQATCVCTGGDAGILVAHSDATWVAVPELNHRGLRCLLSDHLSRS